MQEKQADSYPELQEMCEKGQQKREEGRGRVYAGEKGKEKGSNGKEEEERDCEVGG
jgi:hypothetical protein